MKAATPEARKLFHDGCIALSQVEENGFRIDTDYLDRTIIDTDHRIARLADRLMSTELWRLWEKEYKHKAKLGSREQLAHVLFDKMGYECKNRTKTGRPKTDESAFDDVDLGFVKGYRKWQKLNKVRGTYLKNVKQEVVDGFLHFVFNLHTVKTYRGSADSPSFQNIPVRDPEIAKIIRRAFIPRDGHCLVEIDYGGIEVKVTACYNKDPVLLEYIRDPTKDMHRDMAAQCYMIEPEDVTKKMRYCGKNGFVFPEFYGDYFMHCALYLWNAIDQYGFEVNGTPMKDWLSSKGINGLGDADSNWETGRIETKKGTFIEHIRQVEKDFWENRFKVYAKWKRTWRDAYLKNGGYRTLTGFWIGGEYGRNDVINHPVQGSAFHCLLWSLIQLVRKTRKWKSKIVGQIHDSIIADVHMNELQDFVDLAVEIMTVELPKAWRWIIVPLEAEVEVAPEGMSWFDKKEVKDARAIQSS